MANDLPRDAAGMIAEAENFISVTTSNPAHFGLTAAQLTELDGATTVSNTALAARNNAENTFRGSVTTNREALDTLETILRQLRQIVQVNPATTDTDRTLLHLATGEGGEGGGSISESLATAPLILVENAGVHLHQPRFFMPDEPSSSTRKPKGIHGAKIFMKIDGAASTDLKEYQLIAIDTKSPYTYAHSAANAGKTAHYIALWTTRDDEDSPQSEVFSLVIT